MVSLWVWTIGVMDILRSTPYMMVVIDDYTWHSATSGPLPLPLAI